MIDEPGPWGTGPFTLVQGASSILTRNVIMSPDPYTCAWLIESEDRSPELVLEANLDHWNRAERGPRVQRAVFRNNLSPSRALELCISGDGEVDIVTEVSPADAARVEASRFARLITSDANRVLTCIINRGRDDVPLDSVDVRKALNLGVNRQRIIADGLAGYANEMPAMTPSWCSGFPEGATPYPHDPDEAHRLFAKGGWPAGRPIRIATPEPFAGIAQLVAGDLRKALDVAVEVIRVPEENALAGARALVEKKLDSHGIFSCTPGSTCPPRPRPQRCTASSSAAMARSALGRAMPGSTSCSPGWLWSSMAGSWCGSPRRLTGTVSTTLSRSSCARRGRCTR